MSVTNVPDMNVLSVLVDPRQPMRAVLDDLRRFLDVDSVRILDLLFSEGLFKESTRLIKRVELVNLEEDVPFIAISSILEQKGITPASISSAMDMLHALRGEPNAQLRRDFFSQSLTLLSLDPVVISGKLHYLVIGQDPCAKREEKQRLFSLRLIEPAKLFSHKLYRLITACR